MYRLNRGMWVWVKMEDALRVVPVLIFLLYMFLNFATVLTHGKMNNIIILQHQKPWCFSAINLRVQSGHQFFVLNLKYWYLSKMISFLKCPLIPTFLLLIKTRRCNQKTEMLQKTEMFSLKELFTWEFFCHIFPTCLSTF